MATYQCLVQLQVKDEDATVPLTVSTKTVSSVELVPGDIVVVP